MANYDEDAVQAALEQMRPRIEAIEARVTALEARPSGSALFAARDDFETAVFAAMRDMTDAEQVAHLNSLTAKISEGTM